MNNAKTIAKSMTAALALGMLAACGGPLQYAPHGTAKAPEADAKIVADVHKDGSFTTLNVAIEHLAPPDRLGGGTTFVIWTKTKDAPKWHRVGALSYDESGRKAKIEGASVPVTHFDLQVTTEKSSEPDVPSDNTLIEQQVN
jgi:predicted small lipoprotein YifL